MIKKDFFLRLCCGLLLLFPTAWPLYVEANTLLLEYNLSEPQEQTSWREATTADEALVPGVLIRGPGLSPAILANGFSANQWTNPDDHQPPLPANRENALIRGDYFQFSFTVSAGKEVALDSLEVSLRRSGLGAPSDLEWQYSLDDFATPGVTLTSFSYWGRASGTAPDDFPPFAYMEEDVAGQGEGNAMPLVDLSDIPELQDLRGGQTVTFRLYAWGADRNSRTLAMGRVLGPSLRGTAEAVPVVEPPPMSPRLEKMSEADALRLMWHTSPGLFYEVKWSEDLVSWQTVEGFPLEAAVEEMEYLFPVDSPRRFFRILEFEPPVVVPEREVFFSVAGPTGNEEDLTLEDKIIELLDLAAPDSSVRVALYTWSRSRMADAFIDAYNRGLDVRLIIGSDFAAVQTLRDALPADRVLICPDASGLAGSCHGDGINHNKFVLFSELTDGSRDVVVQSSANFTNPQIRSNNNMVIIREDTVLYEAYLAYWLDLAREQTDLEYFRTVESDSGKKVYFFPRATGPDPIVEILDQLVPGPESSIHVAMAYWTNPRVAIAEKLLELRDAGFEVRVLVNPNNSSSNVLTTLEEGGIPVIRYTPVHSKYMLIDHNVGRQRERLVYTGSHNYTGPALRRNDETLLRLRDQELFEAFMEDWTRMSLHPLAR